MWLATEEAHVSGGGARSWRSLGIWGPQSPPDSQHHSSREAQAASEQTRLGEGCAPNHGSPNRGAHPCCSHQAERHAHVPRGHHLSKFWLGVRAALVAQETGKLGCAPSRTAGTTIGGRNLVLFILCPAWRASRRRAGGLIKPTKRSLKGGCCGGITACTAIIPFEQAYVHE
jgi:hypothetical protein